MRTYFAYGSNMNALRVRERGLAVAHIESASLPGFRLLFDKHSAPHEGAGHANIAYAPGSVVEGVLYWLADVDEIVKMDRFERAPVNYGRDVVQVQTGTGAVACWTYFANPAVRRAGLRPPRSYLNHLLLGKPYLSAGYFAALQALVCAEDD
ncbi:MAG: gamma-glutamylcyclotransferase family protein [Pseudomonadales bacterium]